MWDRAGKIAMSLCTKLPDLEVNEGSPGRVVISSSISSATIVFTPSSFVASSKYNPKVRDGFADESAKVANIILEHLEVCTLTRIGNRIIFAQRRADLEAARQDLGKLAQSKGLAYDAFMDTDESHLKKAPSEFLVRFEREQSGVTVHLKSSTIRQQTAAGFSELFPESPKSAIHLIEADFDVYQHGPIEVDSCSVSDIIIGNVKMIESKYLPKLKFA